MKKWLCFLFAATLLFGMAGAASADSYTLSKIFSTDIGSDTGDVLIAQPNGTAINALTGTVPAGATAASIFDGATFDLILDATNPPASNFKIWLDSAQAVESFYGSSVTSVTYGNIGGNHVDVLFNIPSSAVADGAFGIYNWYSSPIIAGVKDTTVGSHYMDAAYLTINYHNASAAPVPEPATLLMLGAGLLGLGVFRKRFRIKK